MFSVTLDIFAAAASGPAGHHGGGLRGAVHAAAARVPRPLPRPPAAAGARRANLRRTRWAIAILLRVC